ncbi:DUF2238 domain-containing protein [Paenibacillus hamazuiensis]|uniref:DUF2238 domain-containing protein n=1 Tax=Paenibacillus hamazuiensis TaxID=2936508 RepID=UPI00200F3C8E|nr:DUF2238 domain-containing protein [Paenibacillus hamazuiensis]
MTHWLMDRNLRFSKNRLLQAIIAIFAVFWAIMAISPTDRIQWSIENILLVSIVIVLAATYRKFRFSNLSYLLMFLFFCLHTYAAHYTYQNTPFDVWLKTVLPVHRSYFDRVVHFAFGLLMTYPLGELFVRLTGQKGFWSYFAPAVLIFSASALFEIAEMAVAYAAGEAGQEYIGLQGDVFDTQKDMGLGLAGAMITMLVIARTQGENRKTGPLRT